MRQDQRQDYSPLSSMNAQRLNDQPPREPVTPMRNGTERKGRIAGVLLLILIWVFIGVFFGPESVKGASPLEMGGAVVALLTVGIGLVTCCRGEKTFDVFLLVVLVHVCILCCYLAVTHCVVYSRPQDMHPMSLDIIPEDLRNVSAINQAATNALVCFSPHSQIQNYDKLLATQLDAMGGPKMREWGFAFASAVSPIVPMTLGMVHYAMLWSNFYDFDAVDTMLAFDVIDCISMFNMFFEHDPYFLFETDTFTTWLFLFLLYIWWNVSTCQFMAYQARTGTSQAWFTGMSGLLNLTFFVMRVKMRIRTMYCSPILVFKNVFFWLPLCLWSADGAPKGVLGSKKDMLKQVSNNVANLMRVIDSNTKLATRGLWTGKDLQQGQQEPARNRRQSTYQNLQKTEQNLSSVNDKLHEMQKSLHSQCSSKECRQKNIDHGKDIAMLTGEITTAIMYIEDSDRKTVELEELNKRMEDHCNGTSSSLKEFERKSLESRDACEEIQKLVKMLRQAEEP